MKRKRFSVEQIVATLKQIELGLPIAQAARQLGISEQAIYRWKKQYPGLESDQARELKVLQEENARLKRLVADLSLDKAILQDINSKNGPARAEAPGSGLRRRPIRNEPAAGLSSAASASKRALLPVAEGSENGPADPDARASGGADTLWVSSPAGLAAARGLADRQEPRLSPVYRGKPAVALQAASSAQDGRRAWSARG